MTDFNWAHQSVLVTGAAGFIGSHLTERLVALGARTRALVRYNSLGSAGWLDELPIRSDVEVLSGDVRDADSVRHAMRGVDVVFHLAALIGIPYSYEAPLSYMQTNAEGTLNVLRAARDQGTGRVIHTSTSEVYGTARSIPIAEDHPLQAQSPYSASKIAADKLAESFHLSFGLPVTVVRPFNTYGPRQSARAVVPTIVAQALAGGPICLGSTFPTRDLNYVTDTVDGFVRCAECPETVGEVVNIGSGEEISVKDLATLILELVGVRATIESDAARLRPAASEVERLCAGNEKARRLLGWTPQYDLRAGLRETIDWISVHRDRYRPEWYQT